MAIDWGKIKVIKPPVDERLSDIRKALQAICEGYSGEITEGYIIVANPEATPEALALRGVDPNLVIDVGFLLERLGEPR